MKPFLRGKTLKFRQLAYCLETPAFGAPVLLGAVTKVFRETRRSVLLTVLSLAVMMLGLLIPRVARAQVIDYPSGFGSSSGEIWLEDASTLSGTDIQLLNGIGHRANNAWYETPVNVQAFTTSFTWYTDCSPDPTECGEGLGFMLLSNPNPTAAGFTYAGFSGGQFSWSQCVTPFTGSACPSINSILVKFDMYDDQTLTAGANLTGFYSGGEFPQAPYNPQYNMSGSGINMQSGDLMRATLTYNGATLTETVTDTVTGATYTNSYAANIPSLVAGNTAFVGFGAGTGAAISNLYLTTWTYTVESQGQAATPTFSPAAGTYNSVQSVTLSDATSGATIYYTTNGITPTTSSAQYIQPIPVSTTETLKAIAVAAGDNDSAVASAAYTIMQTTVSTPTFSPSAGTYTSAQPVTISDATSGATIYYTTNGSTPTTSSTAYAGPIAVSTTETLEAIAVAKGDTNSAVASAAYTITLSMPLVSTPTFSPAAGTYTSAQSVTISDGTSGATIYYTTNGSTPTTSSTAYAGPIAVSTTETLEAIAVDKGDTNSAVASAAYTIFSPPNFTLGASPALLTVDSGDQGTVTLSVTPQNGFDSPVSFACSGLPVGATCTFAPATVTPSGAAATTQLTIFAGAQSSALQPGSRPFLPFTALAVTVCLFGLRKRHSWRPWLLMAVAYAGLGLLFGCGGSSGSGATSTTPTPSPTPTPIATTSTVTITATSGTLQATTTVTLTVN
jgi:hypothetical protein